MSDSISGTLVGLVCLGLFAALALAVYHYDAIRSDRRDNA